MPDGSTGTIPSPVVAKHSPAAVSVAAIIPLYNGEPFIRDALESVLAQTEPVDEIIVVDDGSTDGGPAIVREMAAHYPIRLLHKPNGGQSSARNMGIAASNCTHIALLDQDDIWYPHHIAVLKQAFIENPDAGLVYGNLDRADLAGNLLSKNFLSVIPIPQPKRSLWDCLAHEMHILPSAAMLKKDAFDRVGGFDERLSGYEDDDLFVRMYADGIKFAYLSDVSVSQWRVNPRSSSFSTRMAVSRMIYFQKLTETFPENNGVIASRFFKLIGSEFRRSAKQRNRAMMIKLLSDLREITRHFPEQVSRFAHRRIAATEVAARLRLYHISRVLLHRSSRRVAKMLAEPSQ